MAIHKKYAGSVLCLAADCASDYGRIEQFHNENGGNAMLMLSATEQIALRNELLKRHPLDNSIGKWSELE